MNMAFAVLVGSNRAGSRRRGGHRSDAYSRSRCFTASRLGKRRGGRACWSRHDRDGHGAAEADRPSIGIRRRKPVILERRTLEGIKKAHGRVGHRAAATSCDGTDSSTEQSLEGELQAGSAQKGGSGNANPGGVSNVTGQRQEGKGRGDTVRLWLSGILRGVGSGAGRERAAWQQDTRTRNATNPTIGSGMQQARGSQAEQTDEVVRNHEVGT